ncbi:MAG: adenosylhomocysteinase [Firmicutes bacterium]|mgnify:FL=1|jgi:adenosylhomocysteinase|nr:adenosylhomocysteinase [Bacillota bacterium]HPU01641.1 adenosylhomocysteinase [Bacillota bacterium]
MSMIRSPELAPQGQKKIAWAARHMPVLSSLAEKYASRRPFAGLKMALCIHLEAKTAYLARVFQRCGAQVAVTGSNPLSTQDDVAAALAREGIAVFGWRGATEEEYADHIRRTIDTGPNLVIDDGGDLITMLHRERPDLLPQVRGGAEETTTGLTRLRALAEAGELAFPVIAVNDALCKYLFDNRYGTGQSAWDGIMRTTNLLVAGKTVVVAGFGWCGRGVAMRARGLGAQVIVTEVDPVRALEAAVEGYRVMPMLEAAPLGDIFITATGCREVIGAAALARLKDGAILANAGHFDVEIDKAALNRLARLAGSPRPNIEEYRFPDGRRVYLLAQGRLVNLAAGDGHPAEIMDLSFALQFLAMDYLRRSEGLPRAMLPLPAELDREVARLKLAAMGITIDSLTESQRAYLGLQ